MVELRERGEQDVLAEEIPVHKDAADLDPVSGQTLIAEGALDRVLREQSFGDQQLADAATSHDLYSTLIARRLCVKTDG